MGSLRYTHLSFPWGSHTGWHTQGGGTATLCTVHQLAHTLRDRDTPRSGRCSCSSAAMSTRSSGSWDRLGEQRSAQRRRESSKQVARWTQWVCTAGWVAEQRAEEQSAHSKLVSSTSDIVTQTVPQHRDSLPTPSCYVKQHGQSHSEVGYMCARASSDSQ